MKRTLLAAVVCYSIAVSGCRDKTVGKIELYDKSAVNLIDTNATIEVIGRNYKWSEGPVWVAAKQMLLFSDVIGNKIYRWSENDTPLVYLTPSGYTDSARRDGENGSNGLTLDKDGRLLLCQSGNRQVARMDAALDVPVPRFTVLSSGYQGKRFNSPNDLVADSRNNIYFTDPIYGLPKQANDPSRELKFEGVYRISAQGETVLLIDSISRPNGIALSPDEKTLYIGSSDDQHPRWYAYQLDTAGHIQGGGVLLDGTEMKARASVKQGADGFKIDGHGNIFSSGPDGVVIISPNGKVLGLIKIFGRPASNCAFNETKEVLYITADDRVLRVKLH
ncbi:SMP-30/gluconolactonase/LRE family protein [Flavitalea sp. BT771]|uniref:SMP-30/gluconolactonase/LRE family protein n=1 Tax=Flavitalea sp. BT771 TaxID=3063329 RepID=UPI0026E4581B|nr:SMP-30/gluconolactonase/LRE family protein [Flavitalea sp. BT771]MDO6433895.1 SMP-30/gluconolactonase/LRE family protein [Flavitalea sp. BT771]MDV6222200.1 SMP-30/gluconolactonase/LRE family protein [Flavitalea sp. BT771]